MEKNEKGADRLSRLADDLLISILSYVDGKTAAQTSVLSKRWMNLWAKVPILDFDFKHFEAPVFRNLKYLKVPESYEKLCNLRPTLRAYVLGFSTDAKIITEFPEKGVEEVKRLKKDIADLKSKTINIMGKAKHLDLEDLKQLEQILNEGLVSVMENKEQLLKEQLDRSKKQEQILMGQLEVSKKEIQMAGVEFFALRKKVHKARVERATLQRKIEELQGYLEDKVPREYSSEAAPSSSQDTGCQIKAGLFFGAPPDRNKKKRMTPEEEAENPSGPSQIED